MLFLPNYIHDKLLDFVFHLNKARCSLHRKASHVPLVFWRRTKIQNPWWIFAVLFPYKNIGTTLISSHHIWISFQNAKWNTTVFVFFFSVNFKGVFVARGWLFHWQALNRKASCRQTPPWKTKVFADKHIDKLFCQRNKHSAGSFGLYLKCNYFWRKKKLIVGIYISFVTEGRVPKFC